MCQSGLLLEERMNTRIQVQQQGGEHSLLRKESRLIATINISAVHQGRGFIVFSFKAVCTFQPTSDVSRLFALHDRLTCVISRKLSSLDFRPVASISTLSSFMFYVFRGEIRLRPPRLSQFRDSCICWNISIRIQPLNKSQGIKQKYFI